MEKNKLPKEQFFRFLIKGLLINAFYISLPLAVLIPLSIIFGRAYHHLVIFILSAFFISAIISTYLIHRYIKITTN